MAKLWCDGFVKLLKSFSQARKLILQLSFMTFGSLHSTITRAGITVWLQVKQLYTATPTVLLCVSEKA